MKKKNKIYFMMEDDEMDAICYDFGCKEESGETIQQGEKS